MLFWFGHALTSLPSGDVWAAGNSSSDSKVYIQHLCPIPVGDASASLGNRAASSAITKARLGHAVAWKFLRKNRNRHEVKDTTGMKLFDSGLKAPGASFTWRFRWSGTYTWKDAVTGRRGTIRVPIVLSKTRGPKTTVTWSRSDAHGKYVFDVQVKARGTGKFVIWKKGVTVRKAVFSPDRAGRYYFRSRVRKLGEHAHSGWSPARVFTRW